MQQFARNNTVVKISSFTELFFHYSSSAVLISISIYTNICCMFIWILRLNSFFDFLYFK